MGLKHKPLIFLFSGNDRKNLKLNNWKLSGINLHCSRTAIVSVWCYIIQATFDHLSTREHKTHCKLWQGGDLFEDHISKKYIEQPLLLPFSFFIIFCYCLDQQTRECPPAFSLGEQLHKHNPHSGLGAAPHTQLRVQFGERQAHPVHLHCPHLSWLSQFTQRDDLQMLQLHICSFNSLLLLICISKRRRALVENKYCIILSMHNKLQQKRLQSTIALRICRLWSYCSFLCAIGRRCIAASWTDARRYSFLFFAKDGFCFVWLWEKNWKKTDVCRLRFRLNFCGIRVTDAHTRPDPCTLTSAHTQPKATTSHTLSLFTELFYLVCSKRL